MSTAKAGRREGRERCGAGSAPRSWRWAVFVLAVVLGAPPAQGLGISVPGTYSTIQAALDNAAPGDTITVAGGTYSEKISFPSSGTSGNLIVLKAATDPTGPNPAIIDGTGKAGANIVLIASKSYVKLAGFEIRNNLGVNDGSGVRVIGSGSNIEISGNVIHEIRGQNAMGITVYGTGATAISDLVIDGNEIFDCDPRPSEALVLNGNVTAFEVTNNHVHDVNNIGIDFIGGETDIQPNSSLVARNGLCRGNTVERAKEGGPSGNGFAGCIYVDGGRDIAIERNVVSGCDLGIEIGAENAGIVTSGVTVRDNFVYANEKAGIVFGGYKASVGRANGNQFLHNTCYKNDTTGEGLGELWIQYAEDNVVRNNIFYSTGGNILLTSDAGNVNTALDYNLWYTQAGAGSARFTWNGTLYGSFAAYRSGTGEDADSLFGDPLLADPGNGDLHLSAGSPAIDAGDPAFSPAPGEADIDGQPRVNGAAVEIGADEGAVCGDGNVETGFGEQCDDGGLVDCDGCDSNCTWSTVCGNGILCTVSTVGEECDDGNTAGGDCCSAACAYEAAAAPCDDGVACTADACDGAGTCVGSATPATGCFVPIAAGKAKLQIKDKTSDRGDVVQFKWRRGGATLPADFGSPVSGTTDYELCVYDTATPKVLFAARAPAGGTCRGRPCWKALGSTTYKYRDGDRTPDGLQVLVLKAGSAGKAKVSAKGKGTNLNLPVLPLDTNYDLTAQLRNSDGKCWQARFRPPAKKNESGQFSDRSE